MNMLNPVPSQRFSVENRKLLRNASHGLVFHPVRRLPVNTLEQALQFARVFSDEIRQDTKSRRIYRNFLALTNSPFEALLAFSVWKVHGLKP